jgi:nucleoside phosphorylase
MEGAILFVVALGWERAAIARDIDVRPFGRVGGALLLKGFDRHGGIWILQTGMGGERAEAAMRWIADTVRPTTVLSTGCAGALADSLVTGDMILAEEIVGAQGIARATDATWCERYRAAAVDAGLRFRRGRLLTVPAILSRSEEKRRLGKETNALAVEMEGAAIADWCRNAGVRFAAARVILDPLETSIPVEIPAVTSHFGRLSTGALLRAVTRRPALIPELARLAVASAKCRRAVVSVHRELIRGLSRDGLLPN